MLIWNFNGQGPYSLPGQVFVAAMGSAAVFTAGLPVAYTGMALSNPATPAGKTPIKLVPLMVGAAFAGTGITGPGAWGLAKIVGSTATAGTLSGFSGIITSPGTPGTATGVGVVTGTFTVLNGTAGPSSNALNFVEVLGAMPLSTAAASPTGPSPVLTEPAGLVAIMPGEIMAIVPTVSASGLASIAWVEVPLNSGA